MPNWRQFDDDCDAHRYLIALEDAEKGDSEPVADQTVCRCPAYKWPHRIGSGLCDGSQPDPDVEVCPECGSDNTIGDHREVGDLLGGVDVWFNRCRTCGHEWNHE